MVDDVIIPPATITPTPVVEKVEIPVEIPGDKKPVEGGDIEKPPAEKPPEKYEFKLPENSLLGKGHLEKIEGYAKENGLSGEGAQKLLERESEILADYHASLINKMDTTITAWAEESKNDPEIGGAAFAESCELSKRVFQKFGSETLLKALNEQGWGNHPEMIRFGKNIGKAMREDQLVLPSGQATAKKSAAELFYKS